MDGGITFRLCPVKAMDNSEKIEKNAHKLVTVVATQ